MLEKILTIFSRLEANEQLLHFHSTSIANIEAQAGNIAKLEAQVGQLSNALNMRDERKLPSQLVVNPRGLYMEKRSTSHLEEVQAITTLRSV